MSSYHPTSIRLSKEKQQLYEQEAMAKDMPLRTYLRQRLEKEDAVLEEIIALRTFMKEDQNDYHSSTQNDHTNILIEMLLLLRQLVQPKQMQLAHGELRRLGLSPWKSHEHESQS